MDLEIELVDIDNLSGKRIWVQLKAQKKIELRKVKYIISNEDKKALDEDIEVEYISYSMEVDKLKYYLSCSFPVLLFLTDLENKEIYWLPIQDEVEVRLSDSNPNWKSQTYATLKIPNWNKLTWEKDNNYLGLRWYALEPARMYAFARLHYYYHEFQYTGRLSGYSIGDGWIDYGEKSELVSSLKLAREYIQGSLNQDVIYGKLGIDFIKNPIGTPYEGIAPQLKNALKNIDEALSLLNKEKYTFEQMAYLTLSVESCINLISTTITMYQGFRGKYLLLETSAVLKAVYNADGHKGVAPCPPARKHIKQRRW